MEINDIEDYNFKVQNLNRYIMLWMKPWCIWIFYSRKDWEKQVNKITFEEKQFLSDPQNKREIDRINKEKEEEIMKKKEYERLERIWKKIKLSWSLFISLREDNKYEFIWKLWQRKMNYIVFKSFEIKDESVIIKDVNICCRHPYKSYTVWQLCEYIEYSIKWLKILNKSDNHF